jgi:acetyl-CoA acetyltransferase
VLLETTYDVVRMPTCTYYVSVRCTSPVVIVESLRSAAGKRNGALASLHPNESLCQVLAELVERAGVNPNRVDQAVGGCGAILTKALWELGRANTTRALVSICCAGGLGTGIVLERI